MRCFFLLATLTLVSACATPSSGPEPSLAPRVAEAIDPRVPVPGDIPASPADPALASQLAELVGVARAGAASFEAKRVDAEQRAAAAGPMASESWVTAQQALSLLIEQYGVTTRTAANIDELGSKRLQGERWIRPADQQAIALASVEVAAISDSQSAAIDSLKERLAR